MNCNQYAQAAWLRTLNGTAFLRLKIYAFGKFSIPTTSKPEGMRFLMRVLLENSKVRKEALEKFYLLE
jgi:hypothetical protein